MAPGGCSLTTSTSMSPPSKANTLLSWTIVLLPLGGNRKNRGPRLDVSPPQHQHEGKGGCPWRSHRAKLQPPETNKNLVSTTKRWGKASSIHQYPILRG